MLPLTVAIVCKNNADTIGRTLNAVRQLADELVVIDSGSTDGTIELVEACRDFADLKLTRTHWRGHVATKQLALDAATRPWVLCLDSDESPDAELQAAIAAAVAASEPAAAGFEINRRVYYLGRPLRHAWQPEWRLRLVRRGHAAWAGTDPHDRLDLNPGEGRPGRLPGVLRHDSFRTFGDHLEAQRRHADTAATALHAKGATGSRFRLATSPAGAFFKQLVLKQAWRDGVPGFLAAGSTAAGALMKHMRLLELDHVRHHPERAEEPAE